MVRKIQNPKAVKDGIEIVSEKRASHEHGEITVTSELNDKNCCQIKPLKIDVKFNEVVEEAGTDYMMSLSLLVYFILLLVISAFIFVFLKKMYYRFKSRLN